MSTRRDFVRTISRIGALSPFAGLGSMSSYAQAAPGYKALVCVFQFGGNDSNNMIVPMNPGLYDKYRTGRGSVALASGALLPVASQAQGAFGLHPQFTAMKTLFDQKRVAFVLNVGTLVRPTTKADLRVNGFPTPKNLYSHSDQQLEWQAANPNGPTGTGWGGRTADAIRLLNPGAFPPSVSLAGNSSLQLMGDITRPTNLSPGSPTGLSSLGSGSLNRARDEGYQSIITMNSGVSLIGSANGIVQAGIRSAQQISDALRGAPPLATVFPNNSLGQQLREVARIISVRQNLGMNRQIFFVSQGGYDNHSDLLPSQAGLLTTLSGAMNAFYNATVELNVAPQVTTFTESEFNRTFTPNGNVGTDHAWGGHQMVMGGAVKGEVYGRMPDMTVNGPEDAGNRGLWIPSLSMDQYAATMATWFGVAPGDLDTVFPFLKNFTLKNVGFMS